MKEFISKNLRYPKKALQEKVEGMVALKYAIDHKGEVVDTKIVSGLGSGCDEEAARLVRSLKFRVPKQKRPGKVVFHKNIKIHFRLPKQKPKEQSQQLQYNITPTPPAKDKPAPDKEGGSYTYTISF